MPDRLGIIGGTGFYDMKEIRDKKWVKIETPFGEPSDRFLTGRIEDCEVVFLARHARGHVLLSNEINYRANIYGMKQLKVSWLIGSAAVGSLKEEIRPLDFLIPDQVVDRTLKNDKTFFGQGIAAHVSFGDPFCQDLRRALIQACQNTGIRTHAKGIYLNIEGPAFSSRAESNLYRGWGLDIVGMTNAIEAKLAREAELCYATIAMVTDYDCWHDRHEDVTVKTVFENLKMNAENVKNVILRLAHLLPKRCDSGCRKSLSNAIATAHERIPTKTKKKLKLLIGKYL